MFSASHLRKSFSQIPREAGDIESRSGPCWPASIVWTVPAVWHKVSAVPEARQPPKNPVVDTGSKGCRQAEEEGVLWDHVGLWDSWTQLTGTWQAKSQGRSGRSFRQNSRSSGRSSVRPWRRTIGRRPRRDSGKPSGASEGGSSTLPTLFTNSAGGELLTSD
ncbi:hypothetical protein L3Q82_007378 [Scortum barcoo]|uniref:Uncharacterized protein n=1 Tax=Scortum barcoo TaxID=214431 RepID=A0ACB8WT10_9TELE|nr:hypothetical protein L3Q82_007378 [Scortum barcoo]